MSARKELSRAIRNPWLRAAALLAVLAVMVTAMLGGFNKATATTGASQVHTYPAGAIVDSGAMRITALKAWRSLRGPEGNADPYTPVQYLVLQVRVDNRTGKSNSAYGNLQADLVWLSRKDGRLQEVKADRFQRADDHTLVDLLHPGMPTIVDMVWKLPIEAELPATSEWGVVRREFSPKATFFGASGWVQGRAAAKLALAVEDRRANVIAP